MGTIFFSLYRVATVGVRLDTLLLRTAALFEERLHSFHGKRSLHRNQAKEGA